MAGLPASRAMVLVGPPLLASPAAANFGLPMLMAAVPGAPVNALDPVASRLSRSFLLPDSLGAPAPWMALA